MTTEWRPHVDLERLSAALSEEIIAAPEAELRAWLADPVFSAAEIVQQVRNVIADVMDESGESKSGPPGWDGQSRMFLAP